MSGFLPSILLTISPSIFDSLSISFILSRYWAAARLCARPSWSQNLLVFLQCLLYHCSLAKVLEFCWNTEFSARHSLSSQPSQGTQWQCQVQEVLLKGKDSFNSPHHNSGLVLEVTSSLDSWLLASRALPGGREVKGVKSKVKESPSFGGICWGRLFISAF